MSYARRIPKLEPIVKPYLLKGFRLRIYIFICCTIYSFRFPYSHGRDLTVPVLEFGWRYDFFFHWAQLHPWVTSGIVPISPGPLHSALFTKCTDTAHKYRMVQFGLACKWRYDLGASLARGPRYDFRFISLFFWNIDIFFLNHHPCCRSKMGFKSMDSVGICCISSHKCHKNQVSYSPGCWTGCHNFLTISRFWLCCFSKSSQREYKCSRDHGSNMET